ncbi:MAG TPA: hypothetical protein VN519_15375 [Bryobacteraceae bacterium]|nr:hypothetical protein [Bryobacteraceae bacterium]
MLKTTFVTLRQDRRVPDLQECPPDAESDLKRLVGMENVGERRRGYRCYPGAIANVMIAAIQ